MITAVLAAGCIGTAAPQAPPPATDAELLARCWDGQIDHAACEEVGHRLLAAGDIEGGIDAIGLACTRRGPPCIELGILYYEGIKVPKDISKARDAFGSACLKDRKDGCAYEAMMLLELGERTPLIQMNMEDSCRFGKIGWPCTNYGVALACGLFGPPQRENALGALQKGCRLGDDRACKLHLEYGEGRVDPECTLIGPDPRRPLAMDLKLGPHGQLPVVEGEGTGDAVGKPNPGSE
jgi:hypothetical protein